MPSATAIHKISEVLPAEYPPQLREVPQPPEKLWMRGQWPAEGTKYLAVVGSRALSAYGREAAQVLIRGLAGYPISIVSGLAIGADACAHRAALDAGLHTVAIPGSGLDDAALYPRTNLSIAKDMLAANGMLLSEHPPDYRAHPYDFPSRNRVMVGLADAVLIIEAGEQSGTLITARLAGEYNRDLLCVPHRIGDAHGHAARIFLRLGASHVTDSLHILEALRIAPREEDVKNGAGSARAAKLSGAERIVYDLLSTPFPRDALIRAAGVAPSKTLAALASLDMNGLITEQFGLWRQT
jgi:DNA processing protein